MGAKENFVNPTDPRGHLRRTLKRIVAPRGGKRATVGGVSVALALG